MELTLRYSLTHNNQYFKLDIFNDINLALLEVESTKENQIISVPKHIKIIDDVTDNPDYYNYNLAVSRMAKVALKGN